MSGSMTLARHCGRIARIRSEQLVAEYKKGGRCKLAAMSDSKSSILDWQRCLNPPTVVERHIDDPGQATSDVHQKPQAPGDRSRKNCGDYAGEWEY
jgi:hypothetical protein